MPDDFRDLRFVNTALYNNPIEKFNSLVEHRQCRVSNIAKDVWFE